MSNPLSESEQDANISSSFAARPGTTDEKPTGVSTSADQSLATSVKDKLSAVADQAPSTQDITEQIPSAQSATDALKSGASALVSGLSNLATGASNATKDIGAEVHPGSDKPQTVDELHIPGAFDDTTSDREDLAAVQQGAQAGARSLQDQVSQGAEYVKQQLPGQQKAVGQQSQVEGSQTHQDGTDYIKDRVFGQGNPTISSVGAASTTSQLAGQVPREPRGVPQVVSDSQRRAGEPPEASSNPDAVLEKRQVERELQREVPEQASSSGPGITQTIAGGVSALGTAAASAAGFARDQTQEATGKDPVSILPESAQQAVDRNINSSTSSDTTYPRVVGVSHPTQQGGIHNTVIGAGSNNPPDSLQQGGIHNRVVGHGSSGILDPSGHAARSSMEQTSSVGVAHVSSVEGVDLSAGVKNTVTGAGSKEYSG